MAAPFSVCVVSPNYNIIIIYSSVKRKGDINCNDSVKYGTAGL